MRSAGCFIVTREDTAAPMNNEQAFARYTELQQYIGWNSADADRVHGIAPIVRPHFGRLVDDFYEVIACFANARRVITGGPQQIDRLKSTLVRWLEELVSSTYDEAYVARRWQVGWRHVEIGLDQVYTNAALSRLRDGLVAVLAATGHPDADAIRSLNKLLDLDLAIIEDAYQTESRIRQQRVDRLAAIGQVAGGVAHELRNPLNVVRTSIYFLTTAKKLSPEKLAEHLARIERQVMLSDNVITALTDFARLPVPELKPIVLWDCLRETLDFNPLPPDVTFKLDLPPDLPPLLGDERQLRIVFGNLIRNARDAMAAGGTLTIGAYCAPPTTMVITFVDTGTGIKPEDLDRIMEPLYSTKARGLGLGLAITRSIIEKHGGRLRASSTVGVGTAFTVELPTGDPAGDPLARA